MSDKFQVIDCKDDVLSFSKPEQTFKLGNFIERVSNQFKNKINDYSKTEGFGFISIEQRFFYSSNVKWESMPIDCEVLKMGANSWQKGKLRIQVTLERGSVNSNVGIQDVCLEFCPDEPPITQPESPLDDLRQMINQENQQ